MSFQYTAAKPPPPLWPMFTRTIGFSLCVRVFLTEEVVFCISKLAFARRTFKKGKNERFALSLRQDGSLQTHNKVGPQPETFRALLDKPTGHLVGVEKKRIIFWAAKGFGQIQLTNIMQWIGFLCQAVLCNRNVLFPRKWGHGDSSRWEHFESHQSKDRMHQKSRREGQFRGAIDLNTSPKAPPGIKSFMTNTHLKSITAPQSRLTESS